jgi:hypothetical protein
VWLRDPISADPFGEPDAAASWDGVPGVLMDAYLDQRTSHRRMLRGGVDAAASFVHDRLAMIPDAISGGAVVGADAMARDPDPIDVELITEDYGAWSIDKVGRYLSDQVLAAVVNARGALGMFSEVMEGPSSNEVAALQAASRATTSLLGALADNLARHAIEVVPGGRAVWSGITDLRTFAKAHAGVRGASGDAAAATEERAVTAFIVQAIERVTEAERDVISNREPFVAGVERHYSSLTEAEQSTFHEQTFLAARDAQQQVVSGPLSISAQFCTLSRAWMAEDERQTSPVWSLSAGQLVITLSEAWEVEDAFLDAPRGDRIAEQLMALHGGSLNVRELAVPMIVQWRGERPSGGHVWIKAYLLGDGTHYKTTGGSHFEVLKPELEARLADRGIPSITRLHGQEAR